MKKLFVLLLLIMTTFSFVGAASAGFTDKGSTVNDTRTGLIWQKQDDGVTRNWGEALSYCEGLNLGGQTDWRLPNIIELESITDDSRYYPSIDPLFTDAKASSYWSSTTGAYDPNYAWYVFFFNGSVHNLYKSLSGYVRCVRAGQSGSLGFIQLSSATYSVNEDGGTVTITATRTGGSSGALGISYATSNGTALAGLDYTSTSNTLSWANGDTTDKIFTVPIINDTLDEVNETFIVTLTTPTGGASLGSPSSATVTIVDYDPVPVHNVYDFNGDGKTDILWRNSATGENRIWVMDGITYVSTIALMPLADTNWDIAGTGDFNGDGQTDILWRNKTDGIIGAWIMDETTPQSFDFIFQVTDLNWEIVGVNDFNGDGKPDLLLRHKVNGLDYAVFLDGTTPTGAAAVVMISDLSWLSVGTGDFNSDGKADIVCRNTTAGNNLVLFVNGTTPMSYTGLPMVADLNMEIVSLGDLNNDGRPDILFRNKVTGDNIVLFMNGSIPMTNAALKKEADTNWKIRRGQ